jgi:hypothetical protein
VFCGNVGDSATGWWLLLLLLVMLILELSRAFSFQLEAELEYLHGFLLLMIRGAHV